MSQPFILSIQPVAGASFQHGFHLGTDEAVARRIAEERFENRNLLGMHTRSVALIRDDEIWGVYDGRWQDVGDYVGEDA